MAVTEAQNNVTRLGLIPVGREEEYRLYPDEALQKATEYILANCEPDTTMHPEPFGVFSTHSNDNYGVVSALKPSLETDGLFRSTSVIVPKLARTGLSGFFGETHLFLPNNPNQIDSEHIKPVEERHLQPFQRFGHYLLKL